MIKGLEHLPNEERLSNLALFSLPPVQGKKKTERGSVNVYKYLKAGGRQMGEARLFLVLHNNRKRSSGFKFGHRKFRGRTSL